MQPLVVLGKTQKSSEICKRLWFTYARRIRGPDTHWFQRFISRLALLSWLLRRDRRSVYPLGTVSLFSPQHRAGTRAEAGCCWDQQRWLNATSLSGCRGKLGSLSLGAAVDSLGPWMGHDWGVWAPALAVLWGVDERTFFWTWIVWQYYELLNAYHQPQMDSIQRAKKPKIKSFCSKSSLSLAAGGQLQHYCKWNSS